MGEYQYYEFLAIDKPLTPEQIKEVRRFSSRARITSSSFVNVYHWGDFRGNPDKFLVRYYDAHVHVANWGTHRFSVAFPADCLDLKQIESYCGDDSLLLRVTEGRAILTFCSDTEEGGDWEDNDGSGWMSSLAPLREDILAGDFRCLYLGWLASISADGWLDEHDDDQDHVPEPPVPPGLADPSVRLTALAKFLRLDPSLLAASRRRAKEDTRRSAEERARKEAERKAKQARERKECRAKLALREEDSWAQAESLIQTKRSVKYEQAVKLLKCLHDLNVRAGTPEKADRRIRDLRKRHATKHSLLRRLTRAGL